MPESALALVDSTEPRRIDRDAAQRAVGELLLAAARAQRRTDG